MPSNPGSSLAGLSWDRFSICSAQSPFHLSPPVLCLRGPVCGNCVNTQLMWRSALGLPVGSGQWISEARGKGELISGWLCPSTESHQSADRDLLDPTLSLGPLLPPLGFHVVLVRTHTSGIHLAGDHSSLNCPHLCLPSVSFRRSPTHRRMALLDSSHSLMIPSHRKRKPTGEGTLIEICSFQE